MMKTLNFKALMSSVLASMVVLSVAAPVALAETTYRREYNPYTHRYEYVPNNSWSSRTKSKAQRAWRNPVVKQAVIGAGIGAATGILSDRTSILKGAGVGAAVGAGTGLLSRSRTLDRHPAVRTALKGAAIGTGVSAVTGHSMVKGAVVGTAAGAGVHYVKKYLDDRRYNRDSWW